MSAAPAGMSGLARRADRARAMLIVGVAVVVVAVDQATKTWALRSFAEAPHHIVWTLQLVVQFNSGIAFSQGTGATAVVTVVAAGVLAVLVVIAVRTTGTFTAVILGLVMGGAVGNLSDRLVRHHAGSVIDWIDLRWWPVFNVADAAISIGLVLVLIRSVLPARNP
jgi:signal peptidase II